MEFYRPTFAAISLKALDHNFAEVRARVPQGTGVLAMVKADAYGHGAVQIAQRLAAVGATAFGVATVEEGTELRDAGISQPILVMGGLMGQGARTAEQIVAARLTPVVHTADALAPLQEAAACRGERVAIHVKIDTGMTRLGARPDGVPQLLAAIGRSTHLQLQGVMTHLAFAADDEYTAQQLTAFRQAGEMVKQTPLLCKEGVRNGKLGPMDRGKHFALQAPSKLAGEVDSVIYPTCPPLTKGRDSLIWHIANSAAVMRGIATPCPAGARIWVRPGIMLYGAAPFTEDRGRCALQPVMSLNSEVILLKHVPRGTKVSYNCTWTAARDARIATVPIGYADGYPWALANKGQVCIRGRRYPVIGRVTMDFLMVDVTEGPEIAPGDAVVLLGRQGDVAVTAEELADWAGTIPYEILTRISKRMPRKYV